METWWPVYGCAGLLIALGAGVLIYLGLERRRNRRRPPRGDM